MEIVAVFLLAWFKHFKRLSRKMGGGRKLSAIKIIIKTLAFVVIIMLAFVFRYEDFFLSVHNENEDCVRFILFFKARTFHRRIVSLKALTRAGFVATAFFSRIIMSLSINSPSIRTLIFMSSLNLIRRKTNFSFNDKLFLLFFSLVFLYQRDNKVYSSDSRELSTNLIFPPPHPSLFSSFPFFLYFLRFSTE